MSAVEDNLEVYEQLHKRQNTNEDQLDFSTNNNETENPNLGESNVYSNHNESGSSEINTMHAEGSFEQLSGEKSTNDSDGSIMNNNSNNNSVHPLLLQQLQNQQFATQQQQQQFSSSPQHQQQLLLLQQQQQQQQSYLQMAAAGQHLQLSSLALQNPQLAQTQLAQHQMALAAAAHVLPMQIMARMGQLPPAQQQQFHIQHQMYLQKLNQLQQAQARGQVIPQQQLQMLQAHQHYLAMLVAGGAPSQQLLGHSAQLQQQQGQQQGQGQQQPARPTGFGMFPPGHPLAQMQQQQILLQQQQQQMLQTMIASGKGVSNTNPTTSSTVTAAATTASRQVTQSPPGVGPENEERVIFRASTFASHKIPLPPWLQAQGEKTHSDVQLASGADLSKVKKKYRSSLCLYCAKIYPQSAWASLKSRKFEHEIFRKHEKSNSHQKALLELNKSAVSGNAVHVNVKKNSGALSSKHKSTESASDADSSDNVDSDGDDDEGADGEVEGGNDDEDGSSNKSSEGEAEAPVKMTVGHFLLDINVKSSSSSSSSSSATKPSAVSTDEVDSEGKDVREAEAGLENERAKSDQTVETSNSIEPDWLKCVSDFCHSDSQTKNGKDVSALKKRHKHMICEYCAEFNPNSAWATSKARLYDMDTFNEHSKSHGHTRAVIQRDLYFTSRQTQEKSETVAADTAAATSSSSSEFQPTESSHLSQQQAQTQATVLASTSPLVLANSSSSSSSSGVHTQHSSFPPAAPIVPSAFPIAGTSKPPNSHFPLANAFMSPGN